MTGGAHLSGESVHYIWKTARHVLAARDSFVVQIRGEAQTLEALEAQETGLRLLRAQRRGGALGGLLVLEADAPVATGDLAKRQRAVVTEFASDPRARIAVVLAGEGALVSLKRTIARGLFRGERTAIFATIREGARWLTRACGKPSRADELVAFAESLRTWV